MLAFRALGAVATGFEAEAAVGDDTVEVLDLELDILGAGLALGDEKLLDRELEKPPDEPPLASKSDVPSNSKPQTRTERKRFMRHSPLKMLYGFG
jgi:hypothetical protein